MSAAANNTRDAFRFFDNREKYLLFVTTCSEKSAVAERAGRELTRIAPDSPGLKLFDAGVGDGTVLCHLLRDLHEHYPFVPWLVVGKEVSMEDVRLTLEKLPDRFHEHPQMVVVLTNLYYSEAPWLKPNKPQSAAALTWQVVGLEGDSSHAFGRQIRSLYPFLAENWQVRKSERTGNPLYVQPSVLVLYRKDREFTLKPLMPRRGEFDGGFDLVLASQPYRSRMPATFKVKNVIAPLARALRPGGRMLTVQSYGHDPGMEIINQLLPEENPFQTGRRELVEAAKESLRAAGESDLIFDALSDEDSLFRYHLHTLPTEISASIGTSTLMAAWNAAIYVAQIEDERLTDMLADKRYLEATQATLQRHGGLWFQDESFVIARRKD